jgi:hypothetical protein
MQEHGDNTAVARETVSLAQVCAVLRRSAWTIVVITLIAGAIGFAWSSLFASYQSHAFFQFSGSIPPMTEKTETGRKDRQQDRRDGADRNDGSEDDDKEAAKIMVGISLSDYKRYAAAFSSGERFADYIREMKLEGAPGVREVQRLFSSRNGISRTIEPVYSFSKSDARDLPDQPKEVTNSVVGLRIDYEGATPQLAQEMTRLLGRYTMDSIIYLTYQDLLKARHDEARTKLKKLDGMVLRNKRRIEEYRQRTEDIKDVIARNPAIAAQAERQVVVITGDSARYVPPVSLLVNTEVQIADLNRAIAKAGREKQRNLLLVDYFERAQRLPEASKSGETVLRRLEQVRAETFKGKDMKDPLVEEVSNAIASENEVAVTQYLEKSRFIAGPSLPTQSTARPLPVVIASLLLGLLLSIGYVVGRRCWDVNRSSRNKPATA